MKQLFQFYNPNPAARKGGDCVVRAICAATDQPWDKVYSDLCALGLRLKAMPSDKLVYKKYLESLGFVWHPVPIKKGCRRPCVAHLAQAMPKGIFVCQVAHHLVTVRDGLYWDLWNSGTRVLYGFWAPET